MSYSPKFHKLFKNINITNSNQYELINTYYITNPFTPISIPIDGDNQDSELRILSNITNPDQLDNIILRLNNNPNNYIRQTIRNDASYETQTHHNHIYLTYQHKDNLFDYNLYLNSGSKRKIVGNILTNETGGFDSYLWNNTIDNITSLDILLRMNQSYNFEGYIKLFRLIQTSNPISLVYNNNFNDEDVNINIDISDCDLLEIIVEQESNSGNLDARYNNDNSNSYQRGYIYNNDNTPIGKVNVTDNAMRLTTVYKANNICRISKLTKIAQRIESYVVNGSERSLIDTVNYTNSQNINSVQIFGNGFIGKIKIYKYY